MSQFYLVLTWVIQPYRYGPSWAWGGLLWCMHWELSGLIFTLPSPELSNRIGMGPVEHEGGVSGTVVDCWNWDVVRVNSLASPRFCGARPLRFPATVAEFLAPKPKRLLGVTPGSSDGKDDPSSLSVFLALNLTAPEGRGKSEFVIRDASWLIWSVQWLFLWYGVAPPLLCVGPVGPRELGAPLPSSLSR